MSPNEPNAVEPNSVEPNAEAQNPAPPRAERVMAMLEEATLSSPGDIAQDAQLLDLAGWDSMGMVMFIGLVDEDYSVELSVHDIRECETPGGLTERVLEIVTEHQKGGGAA